MRLRQTRQRATLQDTQDDRRGCVVRCNLHDVAEVTTTKANWRRTPRRGIEQAVADQDRIERATVQDFAHGGILAAPGATTDRPGLALAPQVLQRLEHWAQDV